MIVWDEAKRKTNLEKHAGLCGRLSGVRQPQQDHLSVSRKGEARKQDIAMVEIHGRVLTLIYVERGVEVQAISFRVASRVEREVYEQRKSQTDLGPRRGREGG